MILHMHSTHVHTYSQVEFQSWVCIYYEVMDVFALLLGSPSYLRIVWTISSNKYERFIDCMICVMKKLCFAYTKRKVWKSCVAGLRIRFRYVVTPLNFLNQKFQLSRCCLLDLVRNLEGRFCRAWVYKHFTCDIRYMFDCLYMYKSFISHLGGI